MNTSYFSKSAQHPNAVSIALRNPPYFTGVHFEILAPPTEILNKYKEDLDTKAYTDGYYKEVLNKLNPREIYNQLGENAVLLCWESPKKFCHRFLCANWFYAELGIKVTELTK